MNKSVYNYLIYVKIHVVIFFCSCKLKILTFKSKHTHDFVASFAALFNQKHSLNIICEFGFHFMRGRAIAPPTELKLLAEQSLGPEGGCRCPCYCCLLYHTLKASFCRPTCILRLNAAIQNRESNQHSGKTLLQEWATMLTWSNR